MVLATRREPPLQFPPSRDYPGEDARALGEVTAMTQNRTPVAYIRRSAADTGSPGVTQREGDLSDVGNPSKWLYRAALERRREQLGWAVADGLLSREQAKDRAHEIDAALRRASSCLHSGCIQLHRAPRATG
jgi:hypothetical protein